MNVFTFPSPIRTPVGGIQEFKVRTETIDGKPWFVAKDVCRSLGLTNPTMAVRSLEPTEVTLKSSEGMRGPPANFVSEQGL